MLCRESRRLYRQGFLAAGLIQEPTLTRIPTVLGKGIPLFGDLPQAVQLMPVHTQQYDNGYVQTRYRVINEAA
ncbi:dihydrofolate reductase family protein [Shewanella profunda]|nr:dihydrofolate reductase family protein [Shewanella profunda]